MPAQGLALSMLAAAAAAPAAARTETCDPLSEAEVARLFDRWNASLATLDPARVAADDARAAGLQPTVSNLPRTTPAPITDDFVTFLKRKPHGRIDERHVTAATWQPTSGSPPSCSRGRTGRRGR